MQGAGWQGVLLLRALEPRRSPQRRRAAAVGDVAGESGDRAGRAGVKTTRRDAFAAHLHPDAEHVSVNRVEDRVVHHNAEAFRRGWSMWVEPWESYRQEIEEVLDCGERVLLLVTHFARASGTNHEIEMKGAGLWTGRDDLIVRLESYTARAEALKAVGLEE